MMLKNISLGIYYPGSSLLHRLQARTKLLVIVMLAAALLIAEQSYWDFTPYFVAVGLVLCGIACSGIGWREIGRRLTFLFILVLIGLPLGLLSPVRASDSSRSLYILPSLLLAPSFLMELGLVAALLLAIYLLVVLLPLPALRRPAIKRWRRRVFGVILVLAALFIPTIVSASIAHPAHTAPRLAYQITYDAVWSNSIFLALFLTLYPCSLLLTMTTSPVALIEGLTMLMKPLRWLHLPVDDFALMALLALRFIPTLLEEVEQLFKAQTARGAGFTVGSLRERLQSVLALFVPFLRNTLRRASELAIALDARGYQVDGQQTRLHEKTMSYADYLVLWIVGVSLLIVLLI